MPASTSRTKKSVLAVAIAAAAVAGTAGPADAATAAAHGAKAGAIKQVSYQGYRFSVPRSWAVVDLTRNPDTCVRFDRHAVYLGHPGTNQACPSHMIGRTEALLIEPATNPADSRGTVTNSVAHQFDVTAAHANVTATFGGSRGLIERILSDAGLLTAPTGSHPTAGPRRGAMATTGALPAAATNYTGKGFDTCAAPSSSTMSTWMANSPYSSVGIYIGGSDRGCAQPNLTASWVQTQYNAGWRFQPIYVGEQAAAISSAASEGTAAADDAVNQAATLGFGAGSTLYYDMEAYSSSYSGKVLAFESAWTKELHAKGYHSAVYSSSDSGISDLVNNYGNSSYTMPDAIYDALWNNTANTSDSTVPAGDWSNHQRVHQYGSVTETWGGVTQSIDQDYLDVQLSASSAPMTNLAAGRL
ncbi:DUF1906 domain-containing protein, partial [Streptacidiphilus monticola]